VNFYIQNAHRLVEISPGRLVTIATVFRDYRGDERDICLDQMLRLPPTRPRLQLEPSQAQVLLWPKRKPKPHWYRAPRHNTRQHPPQRQACTRQFGQISESVAAQPDDDAQTRIVEQAIVKPELPKDGGEIAAPLPTPTSAALPPALAPEPEPAKSHGLPANVGDLTWRLNARLNWVLPPKRKLAKVRGLVQQWTALQDRLEPEHQRAVDYIGGLKQDQEEFAQCRTFREYLLRATELSRAATEEH